MLLQVQLKGAPSLALTFSAAGGLTTGKNKKSGKQKKVLTRLWHSATSALHNLSAVASAKADSNSIQFIIIHEKEIHFAIRIL
jgi:hypothetical protein